jgi:hypothetical protein
MRPPGAGTLTQAHGTCTEVVCVLRVPMTLCTSDGMQPPLAICSWQKLYDSAPRSLIGRYATTPTATQICIPPLAIRVFETNLHIRAPFTKWEPGMPVALGDQLRRPRLK